MTTPQPGVQEPPADYRVFNRRQDDGTYRPLSEFFASPQSDKAASVTAYRTGWHLRHTGQALPQGASEAMRAGWEARGMEWVVGLVRALEVTR